MPIYEYRCGACGLQKEFLQRLNDVPLRDCPECGKPELAKLISAAGFQLKGTGWYATDFKSSGAKPAAKTKQDKPAETKQDKPAESSGSDGPKTDSSKAGAASGVATGPACS
ncbi:MAG: zinc ribbon domain-containing protein [Betaproteobacteria bacterium]|nr:zinc ribbon domain-containing protein [Betaproteobacteria bacterium]MDH3438540.1 zinc ribbon domain-containing protein [Betaproteobacteria bacterium]